jgi:hypothetical protein
MSNWAETQSNNFDKFSIAAQHVIVRQRKSSVRIAPAPPEAGRTGPCESERALSPWLHDHRQQVVQLLEWDAHDIDLSVAINLSPLMLDRPDLVEEIVSLQRGYGIAGDAEYNRGPMIGQILTGGTFIPARACQLPASSLPSFFHHRRRKPAQTCMSPL